MKTSLSFELSRSTDIIHATAFLHNYCIYSKDSNGENEEDPLNDINQLEANERLDRWIELSRNGYDEEAYFDIDSPSVVDIFGSDNNNKKSTLRAYLV